MVNVPRAERPVITFDIKDETVARTWIMDWACRRCGAYGGIKMKIALGPIVAGEKKPPYDDEQIRRAIHTAHNEKNGGSDIIAGTCAGRGERFEESPVLEPNHRMYGVVFIAPDFVSHPWFWRKEPREGKPPRMVFAEPKGFPLPTEGVCWPPRMRPWTVV